MILFPSLPPPKENERGESDKRRKKKRVRIFNEFQVNEKIKIKMRLDGGRR